MTAVAATVLLACAMIHLRCDAISRADPSRLMKYTAQQYEVHATKRAGEEHYRLLAHLSAQLGATEHAAEVGTRYGAGAFALAAQTSATVHTVDVPESNEFETGSRIAQSANGTQKQQIGNDEYVYASLRHEANVHFHRANILAAPHGGAAQAVSSAALVLLDTLHEPESKPFEYAFLAWLGKAGFKGVLLLDDIHLNPEMERLWRSLILGNVSGLPRKLYSVADATAVGHFSGTGLLNFSRGSDGHRHVRASRSGPVRCCELSVKNFLSGFGLRKSC